MALPIKKFGEQLIKTQDLDPVYSALVGAKLPSKQLKRLVLAYWLFYHLGFAAYASERKGKVFWDTLMIAAKNEKPCPYHHTKRWPRSAERRHFRGPTCVRAIEWFSEEPPEAWVEKLLRLKTQDEVMAEIGSWALCGPWVSFKAADMIERVFGKPIKVQPDIGLVYSEPRKSLDILHEKFPELSVEQHYKKLLKHFGKVQAPPTHDRPCGPLEVETVLCKWKSHLNGRYEVGNDTKEVIHGLAGGWGTTADKIRKALESIG